MSRSIAVTDRRHLDVPGYDRAGGRSLPSVVVMTGGKLTLASSAWSSWLAIAASKVDRFSGSVLHILRSVKHTGSKH